MSQQRNARGISEQDRIWMGCAIQLSLDNVTKGSGGPFGAVIVKGGEFVSDGVNLVVPTNDPTAHAEIVAIRRACEKFGSFQLTDCVVYSSCEPCPMCLGALYWARPAALYFANTRADAAAIGFDDQFIYDELRYDAYELRSLKTVHIDDPRALEAFVAWRERTHKTRY